LTLENRFFNFLYYLPEYRKVARDDMLSSYT
jgi:hypothetical protein